MAIEHDLLDIERQLWTGGPEAYEAHLDEQCLVAFKEMAGSMTRQDIAKTAERGRWKDVTLKLKGIATLTDTSAVISYECTAKRNDDQSHRALVSSAYVKRKDGWKLAFHTQTALDAGRE